MTRIRWGPASPRFRADDSRDEQRLTHLKIVPVVGRIVSTVLPLNQSPQEQKEGNVNVSTKARVASLVCIASIAWSSAAVPANAAIIPYRCTYTASQPTLRSGSSGTAVRQAQCEYNYATRGTNIAQDGSFGPITRSSIIRFQRCVGITADGVVGPVTWSYLNYWASSNSYPSNC